MEQLWERNREGRKETNRKAEYKNQEGMHERLGRREWGKRKKRKWKTSTGKATVRRRQEEKERKKQKAE